MQLIERNFREKFGELDIIMQDADCTGIRGGSLSGQIPAGATGWPASPEQSSAELINCRQAATSRSHPRLARRPCRFDVVSITGSGEQPKLRWVAKRLQLSRRLAINSRKLRACLLFDHLQMPGSGFYRVAAVPWGSGLFGQLSCFVAQGCRHLYSYSDRTSCLLPVSLA